MNTTKSRILRAARHLAEHSQAITGVTISLESVARQAGLTKPGLMYHYPTKEALMFALVEQAALSWDRLLERETGSGPGQLPAGARHRAYVTVATRAEVSRADYWIFTDALYHPALGEAWRGHLQQWFSVDGVPAAAGALLTAARFCADGAWMSEATGIFRADDLAGVRAAALELVGQAEHLIAGAP